MSLREVIDMSAFRKDPGPGGHAAPPPGGDCNLGALRPVVRLHMWLESPSGMCLGMGRILLLANVERLGSLSKAADAMGMSYRAAWGKIKQSENALGISLIESRGTRRDGVRLTEAGRELAARFRRWFDEVESTALNRADAIFPWKNSPFTEDEEDR